MDGFGLKVKKGLSIILDRIGLLDYLIEQQDKKYNSQYIRILNYHNTHGVQILNHIRWIKEHYQDVNYRDFCDFLSGKSLNSSKPSIMLTFDDGLIGNYETTLSALEKENMTGYFMISADMIGKEGYMSKEQIQDLLSRGHIIGCHTATHHRMDVNDSIETTRYEVIDAKTKLEQMFSIPIDIFCWVGGEEHTYTKQAQDIIKEAGYKYSFMTNSYPVTKQTDRLHIQRINVEDTWSISLLKFQVSGLMDMKLDSKRKRIDELTR